MCVGGRAHAVTQTEVRMFTCTSRKKKGGVVRVHACVPVCAYVRHCACKCFHTCVCARRVFKCSREHVTSATVRFKVRMRKCKPFNAEPCDVAYVDCAKCG